jgi:hypothetical protein
MTDLKRSQSITMEIRISVLTVLVQVALQVGIRTFVDELVIEVLLIEFNRIIIWCHELLELSLPYVAHIAELWRTHRHWVREVVAVEERVNTPADRDQESSADDDQNDVSEQYAAHIHDGWTQGGEKDGSSDGEGKKDDFGFARGRGWAKEVTQLLLMVTDSIERIFPLRIGDV